MPKKLDQDTTAGVKLLRMFRKLMFDGRKHFQMDLAEYLSCSPQTVMRLASEIESVIGINFDSGTEDRRKWYRIKTSKRSSLGLNFEELRYLSLCRDLSAGILPDIVLDRINGTILRLSIHMAEYSSINPENFKSKRLAYFSKGQIDYEPHMINIDRLIKAMEDRSVCLVKYKTSSNAAEITHRFVPGRLVSMNNALYVLGVGLNRDMTSIKHLTSFAIHRIKDVCITEIKFAFDMPEVSPDLFGLPWHEPRKYSIYFQCGKTAEYVKERIWSENQKLTETEDGGVILEITSQSEPELMSWVLSFGGAARIIPNVSSTGE